MGVSSRCSVLGPAGGNRRYNEEHRLDRSRLFFALFSLTVVWFAFAWCRKYYGIHYAALASFSAAIWFELVNFGPRALNELLAGNLFLPAIYLGSLPPEPKGENKWRLVVVGLLLGLTACLRIQYAPAVAVAGIWIMSQNWKARWLPVSAAAATVVALFGIVDALTWSFPFYSYWAYFRENIVNHKAAGFGILPWYYYFASLFVPFANSRLDQPGYPSAPQPDRS